MSSCWKSACPIFTLNRWVHSAARTFSGPPISLLTRLWLVPSGYKLHVEWEGELSLFNNEFVLFWINNQVQLSVHLSNNCLERVLEIFFTLYEAFISTLHLNRTVCLVVMADVFIRWHSYIIVPEETVTFNMLINLSGPFLTRVSTLN